MQTPSLTVIARAGRRLFLLVVLLAVAGSVTLWATGSVTAQEAQPAAAPAQPVFADPSDEIVGHIDAMTAIVKDNLDAPDEVKTALKAYIQSHGADMKSAGDRFEAHLKSRPVDERETYKETLQRKMEKSLSAFLGVMLNFSERHPEAAKELDEVLQAIK